MTINTKHIILQPPFQNIDFNHCMGKKVEYPCLLQSSKLCRISTVPNFQTYFSKHSIQFIFIDNPKLSQSQSEMNISDC